MLPQDSYDKLLSSTPTSVTQLKRDYIHINVEYNKTPFVVIPVFINILLDW